MEIEGPPGIAVDWLILADFAEVVNGKLYLMGGGWEMIIANNPFPLKHKMALATAVAVPWTETNQIHHMVIEVQNPDGTALASIEAHFEIGRPPGIPYGTTQRSQVAINMDLEIAEPGNYTIAVRIDGEQSRHTNFSVVRPAGS